MTTQINDDAARTPLLGAINAPAAAKSSYWPVPKRYLLTLVLALGFFQVRACARPRVARSDAPTGLCAARVLVSRSRSDARRIQVASAVRAHCRALNARIGGRWTDPEQGVVLSSFFYGYAVTQLPGGYVAQRIGAKHLLTVAVAGTALLTLLTPLVARHVGVAGVVALRVLEGLAEAAS